MNTEMNLGMAVTECPACGGHEVIEMVTVSSGIWERQFLECGACGRAIVAAWRNTHHDAPASASRHSVLAASEAAA
jgi:uncharacterized Zn finger protein